MILDQIVEDKKKRLPQHKAQISEAEMRKLAEETVRQLDDYDVAMWEKHGVFAIDTDIMQAFDQIDVLNKSALIYIASKNMGEEPEGMSDEQMAEMTKAFNLPK